MNDEELIGNSDEEEEECLDRNQEEYGAMFESNSPIAIGRHGELYSKCQDRL